MLYLDSFDESNMFDLEHKNKFLYDVSEVLRSEMNRRGIKYTLNFCEDAVLNLIDLTVKITVIINLKKPGILKYITKKYDCVLQDENDSDTECESFEYYDYDVLSEDSDTGESISFRNMKQIVKFIKVYQI